MLPHARKMDFTGRPMKGMLFVGADGVLADHDLSVWVSRGVSFAKSRSSQGAVVEGAGRRLERNG